MQSLPYESQMSLDLLEDLKDLDSRMQISQSTQSQASQDLLEASQLIDVGGSQLAEVDGEVDRSQLTEADGLSLHQLGESGPNTCRPRSRISFMNRCIRATKSFFLLSPEGNLYNKIDRHAYLNGKIIAVPRKGITEYKILWDTSSLPHLVLDESKLRRSISRVDNEIVSQLKRARVLFDEVYPNGPMM